MPSLMNAGGLWLTPGCVDGGYECRKLSDRFSAHEARQVQDSAMRPPAAGTPSVMGIDERVLGGLTGRARFDSSSRFSLPSSVITRLTFPGRTRSTLLYFCAVQPSLQSQHWLAFYVGLFLSSYFSFPHPRPPTIVYSSHLVSVTIESYHAVNYHKQPKRYLGSDSFYPQQQRHHPSIHFLWS